MKKTILALGLMTVLLSAGKAQAVPFSFAYTDAIVATSFPGLSPGQTAIITLTLDNGGTTNVSQTWDATHLQSVTFNFNNGALVTTFSAPFDGGLLGVSGNFVSDAAGSLIQVMSFYDNFVYADYITTLYPQPTDYFYWILSPTPYFEIAIDSPPFCVPCRANVILSDDITIPSNWSPVSIPEPATLTLLGLGLAGLAVLRRRKQ